MKLIFDPLVSGIHEICLHFSPKFIDLYSSIYSNFKLATVHDTIVKFQFHCRFLRRNETIINNVIDELAINFFFYFNANPI